MGLALVNVYTNSSCGGVWNPKQGLGHMNNWGHALMEKYESETEKQDKDEVARKDLISDKA